jgi:phosphoribosylanthranilate isomerase
MKNTFIKICGIKTSQDALTSIDNGADAIGFIQTKESSRFISLEGLNLIKKVIGNEHLTVPVFVNPTKSEVDSFLNIFPNSIIQFHGEEDILFCSSFKKQFIKAINFKNKSDLIDKFKIYKEAFAFLVDSGNPENRGGTGDSFDWKLIPKELEQKIIIAGGLDSNNIHSLFEILTPFGVDVSSGVESIKGVKDFLKIKNFIDKVRNYE